MRILFVTARPPWPGRRGDQARTAGFASFLAERHEVRILAQRWQGFAADPPPAGIELVTVPVGRLQVVGRLLWGAVRGVLADALWLGGLRRSPGRPFQNGFFDQPAFRRRLRAELNDFRPDVVVLVLSRLGHLVEVVEEIASGVPVVVDLVDALALNFAQRAARERLLSWLWTWESRRLGRWDAALSLRVARATVVAERDRAAVVRGASAAEREAVAESVEVVPFGLSLPEARSERDVSGDGPLVALTGNLGYFPTVDGALAFAELAWPAIRQRVPGARWLLAGARPAREIQRLADLPGVEIVADPPDLHALARRATVALAPLRSGSGTPIKILEAMSLGVPVVATPEAAGGLDGVPDDALAVAEDFGAFAEAVCELLENPERRLAMAESAWRWLVDRHGLAASARRFETALETVVEGEGLARAAAQGVSPPVAPTS